MVLLDFLLDENRKLVSVGVIHEGAKHCTADIRLPARFKQSLQGACIVISDATKDARFVDQMQELVEMDIYTSVKAAINCTIQKDHYTYICPEVKQLSKIFEDNKILY